MSCKSAIYTANTTSNAISAGGTVPLGSVIRRYGNNCRLSGNQIDLEGAGYYSVKGTVTLTGTVAGTAVVTLYKDGVAVPGAVASLTVAADTVYTVPVIALVRNLCCNVSALTLGISGVAMTVNSVGIEVEKI